MRRFDLSAARLTPAFEVDGADKNRAAVSLEMQKHADIQATGRRRGHERASPNGAV
jgi:hypothetical protein